MLYEPKDARVGVEVDYFDEGHGKFTITYDGLTGNFTDGEIVQLEDTGEWKTHTFYLYDAEFANGFLATGGAWDFRIGEWSEVIYLIPQMKRYLILIWKTIQPHSRKHWSNIQ